MQYRGRRKGPQNHDLKHYEGRDDNIQGDTVRRDGTNGEEMEEEKGVN